MAKYHFLNGKIVNEEDAKVSVKDIALGRGYGIFDYFQVREGVPIHMKEHVERFQKSARLMRLNLSIDMEEIGVTVSRLLEMNNQENAGIKLIGTGGVSPNGFHIGEGSLAIVVLPYAGVDQKQVDQGVKLLSFEYQRLLPEIKSINYLYAVYLSQQLEEAGAIEPLYYTKESVRETARANIMAVIDGKIITPHEKLLEGITRRTIIDHAPYPIELRNLTMEELVHADEVFLCGTTKRALAVTKIDDHVIGNGKPGSLTMDIREMLIRMEGEK